RVDLRSLYLTDLLRRFPAEPDAVSKEDQLSACLVVIYKKSVVIQHLYNSIHIPLRPFQASPTQACRLCADAVLIKAYDLCRLIQLCSLSGLYKTNLFPFLKACEYNDTLI